MNRQELVSFLKAQSPEMHERFGVTRLGLVGSYARDEATEQSDIDIVVELQSDNKFRSFFNLLHYLEDSLHIHVDLATEASLKPLVRNSILKDIIYV